jgi:hypothetical protein
MSGLTGLSGLSGASAVFGGFSPRSLPGLQLWLKADAGTYQNAALTTPATADADPVGGWEDQSGSGNDVLQVGVAATRPTLKLAIKNGKPVLRCDGGDYLKGAFGGGALSQPFMIFAVTQFTGPLDDGSYYYLTNGDDAVNLAYLAKRGTAGVGDPWAISAASVISGGAADANWHIWSALFNGASSEFWIDGVSVTTGNAGVNVIDGFTAGAFHTGGNGWVGDIGEMIVYDPAPADDDRQRVQQYLSTRWGVTLP